MREKQIRIVVLITFIFMILMNWLANALPLNGVTSGEVSDSYFNLFAPIGLTFSIWGLIYLLLAGYVVYQLGVFQANRVEGQTHLLQQVGLLFAVSSLANGLWVLAWHYYFPGVALLLILIIFTCLYRVVKLVNVAKLSAVEKYFVQIPFHVYFGWITVATVANIVVFLVSTGWEAATSQVVTVVFLLFALGIGLVLNLKFKSLAYGLVLIWAFAGILGKHLSPVAFNGQYLLVIIVVTISLFVLVATQIYILSVSNKKRVGKI